jgi:hypothetical protein
VLTTIRKLNVNKCGALSALLVVVAIATVLITPDPTDDVNGIVRPRKSLNASVTSFLLVQFPTLFFAERMHASQGLGLRSPNLPRLLCTFRC